MTTQHSLFRAAAVNAQKTKWHGDIILIRPVTNSVITAIACASAAVLIAFLVWGTYTKRSTVSGQLLPSSGLVKVYVPQIGIVLEKRVAEGQQVNKGDVLYVLSSERQSSSHGDIQAAVSQHVESRRESLVREMDKTRQLHREERDALTQQREGLDAELRKTSSLIEVMRNRVRLSEEGLARYQGLVGRNYVSQAQLQQKQEESLDQRTRLQQTEREQMRIARELAARRHELSSLTVKHQNQLAQLDREISSLGQELTESEGKRRLVITAPEGGTATAVVAEVGQTVDLSRPLVSIVPKNATLQAHLYAPSKAIGFIKPGNPVLLRYQAYPYQKFGHAQGTVASVARTALPSSDISNTHIFSGGNGQQSEPLYRITVNLASQSIDTYGQTQSLQAGMLLDADVLQDTRRIFEWVLEPLFSLSSKY